MTSFGLKLLAMISMIFDHVGLMFFQNNELIYLTFRMIGRLAFPIFAFQLAVGFSHSKNKKKHIVRMLIFALISQLPSEIYLKTALPNGKYFLNIGFTFSLALLGMYAIDRFDNWIYKLCTLIGVIVLSHVFPVDYGVIGVLICISFYIFRNQKYLNLLSSSILMVIKIILDNNLMKSTMIYALLPIHLYNGKKGLDNKLSKWLFYAFYPTHLLLLTIIKMII